MQHESINFLWLYLYICWVPKSRRGLKTDRSIYKYIFGHENKNEYEIKTQKIKNIHGTCSTARILRWTREDGGRGGVKRKNITSSMCGRQKCKYTMGWKYFWY